MKLRGNAQMRVGNYGEACQTYEQVSEHALLGSAVH